MLFKMHIVHVQDINDMISFTAFRLVQLDSVLQEELATVFGDNSGKKTR